MRLKILSTINVLTVSIVSALCLFFSFDLYAETTLNPSHVEVVKNSNSHFALNVNGKPFKINGVGMGRATEYKARALKAAGGNAFRTWDMRSIESDLALAKKYDLMVAVGIATGKQLQGFDYNDQNAVAKQYQEVIADIEKYKNHPNILLWVVANEPNLLFDEQGKAIEANPKVYDALADIIDYIHKNDPHHPATLALAAAREHQLNLVLKRVPNIDILSVQLYGDLAGLQDSIAKVNVDKPYMVTEFGPLGHWEMPSTSWGREIEQPSAIKAQGMAARMQTHIIDDTSKQVLGGFAFFWGQKQERTPTWYGMFNESGEHTARIDELTRIWTGKYPENRAPLSTAILIDGAVPTDNVTLKPNQNAKATVHVSDPDGDALNTSWVIMEEVTTRSQGGHFEAKPAIITLRYTNATQNDKTAEIEFTAPAKPGQYRLFSYSSDSANNVGNANIPFLVE